MKYLFQLALLLITQNACALLVTIEPDHYETGTNLSNVSSYATLSTVDGGDVYASSIHRSSSVLAAQGNGTGILGDKVFSYTPLFNSEWSQHYSYPSYPSGTGLEITFKRPINTFSILAAELFNDGLTSYDSPYAYYFDHHGNLIHSESIYSPGTRVNLAQIQGIPSPPAVYWNYYDYTYNSSLLISKVIIDETSLEVTTLDRISFNVADVPEPISIFLMLSGLFCIRWSHTLRN